MHLWLSQTMTWLHTQVRCLPNRVESRIVCDAVANLDQFPAPHLVSADRDGAIWRFLGRHSWQIAHRRHRYLLERVIQTSGAKILHSHFGDRGYSNIDTCRRTEVRHIVTFYGYDVGRLPHSSPEWRARYLELFGTADLLLCEGPFMAQTLVQLGCSAEKIKVHHLGIDTHSIVFQPRSWSPGDPLRVLLSGTFTEKKGLTYAIRALSKLAKSVPLQVIVIGDADERPDRQQEKRRILATVEQTNMSDRIRFLGFQPHRDLIRIASGCHIFLSPSVTASDGDSEGGAPVSIIEMAASGMPVVSTRHCDIPEVLEDGVSGLLADERDVNGLAEKLQWLVDHPDAWAFIAANARRRIEAEFDATTQGLRLVELYDAVVGAL